MPAATHQTVRLGPGRHRTAGSNVCVMELASILAGEDFTDAPRCADPVLGQFLRALNDDLPGDRRQELRPYAAAVVGTVGAPAITRQRWKLCLRYANGRGDGLRARFELLRRFGVRGALQPSRSAPRWAVAEIVRRRDPIIGLDVLDALIDLGRAPGPGSAALLLPPPRPLDLGQGSVRTPVAVAR